MISSKNIYDDMITFEEPRYLTEEEFEKENKRTNIGLGDVLLTIVGTVGRAAVVDKNIGKITVQRSVAVLHPNKDICESRKRVCKKVRRLSESPVCRNVWRCNFKSIWLEKRCYIRLLSSQRRQTDSKRNRIF